VTQACFVQGRQVSAADLALIGQWLQDHPSWHRTQLSRQLCEHWNWRNQAGRLKDMACRTLLLKLETGGLLQLPPRRIPPVNARRNRQLPIVSCQESPTDSSLAELGSVELRLVESSSERALFRFLLGRYHYLSYGNTVGQNMKYLLRASDGRPLGAMLFGAAAWKCAARDLWIGWSALQRRERLAWIANNARFLILPWVRVPCLASHALGLAAGRICRDWQNKYGHRIELLETFVEGQRFRGACYQAAGWQHVGQTTGRTRNDVRGTISEPIKEVFIKPLCGHWKERLLA
jgi:Domain of unknown function (DUF4338)